MDERDGFHAAAQHLVTGYDGLRLFDGLRCQHSPPGSNMLAITLALLLLLPIRVGEFERERRVERTTCKLDPISNDLRERFHLLATALS